MVYSRQNPTLGSIVSLEKTCYLCQKQTKTRILSNEELLAQQHFCVTSLGGS